MGKRWTKRWLTAVALAMFVGGGAMAQDWNTDTNITVNTNVDVANINGCRVTARVGILTAGTLNVNNGNLEVASPADSANFGAINITLGDNNTADEGSYVWRCAIEWGSPVHTAGTAAMIAGKLKLSGGKIGSSYGVFENFTNGEDAAVSAAIKNAGSIYSYDVSYILIWIVPMSPRSPASKKTILTIPAMPSSAPR